MRLLQVLPSVIRRGEDGALEVDTDFIEAQRVYLEHFDSIVVACPISAPSKSSGVVNCRPIATLPWSEDRLKFLPLPQSYAIADFVRTISATKKTLKREIASADYILVSPHTLIGDWPTVALHEVLRQRKKYYLEADVVYETLAMLEIKESPKWKCIIKQYVLLPLFRLSYRYALRHSSVCFFQGGDVYDAYARFCANPHNLNYHIPVYAGSHITRDDLDRKLSKIYERPLRLVYAGRAIEMKGPMDWLNAVHDLLKCGVPLQATWFGDGPLLAALRKTAEERGISSNVRFPGFVDHEVVLDAMKTFDIFLFCHKTLELARVPRRSSGLRLRTCRIWQRVPTRTCQAAWWSRFCWAWRLG